MNVHELIAVELGIPPELLSIDTHEGDAAVQLVLRGHQVPVGASAVEVWVLWPDRWCTSDECSCDGQDRAVAAITVLSCSAEARLDVESDDTPTSPNTRRAMARLLASTLERTAPLGVLEHLRNTPIEDSP